MPRTVGRSCAPVLPSPRQLAGLGQVLCLYRARQGAALAGWTHAVRTEVSAAVDSHGLLEGLWFYDRDDRECWRLYLLPDTDALAWDRVALALPPRAEPEAAAGLCARLWRQWAEQLRAEPWSACVLRLHALPAAGLAAPVLAASLAQPSAIGLDVARAIAWRCGVAATALVMANPLAPRSSTPFATSALEHAHD